MRPNRMLALLLQRLLPCFFFLILKNNNFLRKDWPKKGMHRLCEHLRGKKAKRMNNTHKYIINGY